MQQTIPHKNIEEMNQLVASLTPGFAKLVSLLRSSGVHDFEVLVPGGNDKLVWQDSSIEIASPNEAMLTDELMHILDQAYPPRGGFSFMGLIWNPNRAIAEKMAKTVSLFRKRDRAQVEAQIVALLAAFKQGS